MLFDIQHTLNENYCMLTNQTVDWRYSCVQHSRTPVDSIFIRHTQVLIRTYHLKELVPKLYPAFHHHYHTHSVNCCKRWTRILRNNQLLVKSNQLYVNLIKILPSQRPPFNLKMPSNITNKNVNNVSTIVLFHCE